MEAKLCRGKLSPGRKGPVCQRRVHGDSSWPPSEGWATPRANVNGSGEKARDYTATASVINLQVSF